MSETPDTDSEPDQTDPETPNEYDERLHLIRSRMGDLVDEYARLMGPRIRSRFVPDEYDGLDLEVLEHPGYPVVGWAMAIETHDPMNVIPGMEPAVVMCMTPLMQSPSHSNGILKDVLEL